MPGRPVPNGCLKLLEPFASELDSEVAYRAWVR
jgi:hypothetical protein